MPSDSIAGFLDEAKASRVLFPEQVEQLIRQPDIPQSDLTELCEYLESRGVLTRFQANAIRAGRGFELNFAGYPVIDEIGPCPGGTAFRALHPSLRTPLVLRKFRADSLAPADSPAALVGRARSAASLTSPHLATLLDAGTFRDEFYATVELPADAADLDSLVKDIGPMPAFLAADFGRQAAAALRAAHERGLWHGDVRPANLLVGPLTSKTGADGTVKRRPAPNAAAKLAELGLVPTRPPAATSPYPEGAIAYLPPERVDAVSYAPAGDLYGLGATLYYLLTGRAPFAGGTAAELLNKVRSAAPAPLATLRPDLPTDFAALVTRLMAKQTDQRPATAAEAEAALAQFCRPGTVPKPSPSAAPAVVAEANPFAESVPEAAAAPSDEWSAGDMFSTAHAPTGPAPKRQLSEKDKKKTRLMIILGLCLHLTAVAVLVAWLTGLFDRSEPDPQPAPTKKSPNTKPKKKDPSA